MVVLYIRVTSDVHKEGPSSVAQFQSHPRLSCDVRFQKAKMVKAKIYHLP